MAKSEKGVPVKQIARERISSLFNLAEEKREDSTLSNRYVALAREISMRQRLRLSKQQKRTFCRSCGTYFVPGNTFSVDFSSGKAV